MKTGMIALGRQRLERLVILVDVRVFAMQVNAKAAKAYASIIHSCVQRMLAACNEHSSGYRRSTLWAYKLFDSSLSPLASRSTLNQLLKKQSRSMLDGLLKDQSHLVRFSTPEENLAKFQEALQTVAVGLCRKENGGCQQGEGKLDFVVRALQELFSDFMWGPLFLSDNSSSDEDWGRQERSNGLGWDPLQIRENVVILFSPLPTVTKRFANFVDALNPPDSGVDQDLLRAFSRKLKFLQEPFRLHNIHTCWIDIPVSTSTLPLQGQELPVSSDLEQRIDRCSIHSELAAAKWSFMALDAFAIASDSIPKSLLWSSIAYPAPPVGPNCSKMFAKLRIIVQDRNVVKHQPEVCRVVVVPLVSNSLDTRFMKENALHPLSKGTSFVKSISSNSQDSQVLPSTKMKIVLKSLVPKQDVVLKIGFKRYLLYHHAGVGTIGKKESDTDSAQDQSLRECSSQMNDSNHNTYADEIFQQLQQQPMKFEPGEPAWQLLLIAIARTQSVAKVDLYQDGLCISAILEPITVHYAVLMQEDQGFKLASSESLMFQSQSLTALYASGPLAAINEVENRSRVYSASDVCATVKQGGRPERRSSPVITEQDGLAVQRERLACVKEGKQPSSTRPNHRFKGETYSRTKHWQFILQRGTVGTGKHQIENTYVRPRQGQRPTKVLLTLKYWLDQLHVYWKPQAALQDMPSSSMVIESNTAAPDETRSGEEDDFVAKFDASYTERSSSLPTEMHRLNPVACVKENVLTEEQAEAYLLSIEGMVQDCLKSEDVDIQKFAKLVVKKAQEAQQVLCKRDMRRESMQAIHNDMQGKTIDAGCMVLTVEEGTSISRGSNTQANLHCDSEIFETEGSTTDTGEERDLADTQGISVACGYGAMQQLEIDGTLTVDNIGMHTDNLDQSKEDLDEVVAHQLVKKLLVKPRKLARLYKDYQSPSLLVSEGMTEGNHSVHSAKEKVRVFELQIVLRMELIARDSGGPLEKHKKTLVKEICQLLDGILFHFESLNDYCNRVINKRYNESLPKTVAGIFDMMEFNGYTEPVSDAQPVLCSPGADTEDYCELTTHKGESIELQSEANKLDITNQSTAAIKSSKLRSVRNQRSKSQGLTTEGIIKRRKKAPAFTNELTKANEKRKLARRLTHFGGPDSHHKLKKVTLHNQAQSKPPRVSSSTLAKPKASEKDVILETPMVDRHLPLPKTPLVPDLDDQVESLCARVVMSSGRFGFRTPARSRPHQTTSRRKRLILGSHKKPVGRGLPRIALEAMRAMKARKELQRALDNSVQEPLCQPGGHFEQPGLPCSRKRMSPDPDRQGQYEGGIVKGSAREVLSPSSEKASRLLAQAIQKESEALKQDVLLDKTGYKWKDTFNLSYGLSHSPVAASTSEIWSLSRECSMPVSASQAVDTWDDVGLNIRENLEMKMTRSDSENRRKSPRTSPRNEEVLPLCSSLGSDAAVTAATPCTASTNCEAEIGAQKMLEVQVANTVEDGEIVDLKTRGSVRQKRRKSLRTSKLNKMESPNSSPMGTPTDSMLGGQACPRNETQQFQSTEERAATEGEILESTQTLDRSSRRKRREQASINASVDILASRGLCQSASPELERSSLLKVQKDSHWKICRPLEVCSTDIPITSFIRRPDGDANHADLEDSRIIVSQDLETTEELKISGQRIIHQQPTRNATSDRSKSPTSLVVCTSGRLQVVNSASILTAHQNSQDDALGDHNRIDSPLILSTVVTKIQLQPLFQATPESNDDLALLELCSRGTPEPRLKPEARLSTSYHRAHERKKVGLVPEDGELQGGMLEDGGKENCSPMLKRKTRGAREESPGQYAIRKQKPGLSRRKKSRSTTCSPQ